MPKKKYTTVLERLEAEYVKSLDDDKEQLIYWYYNRNDIRMAITRGVEIFNHCAAALSQVCNVLVLLFFMLCSSYYCYYYHALIIIFICCSLNKQQHAGM